MDGACRSSGTHAEGVDGHTRAEDAHSARSCFAEPVRFTGSGKHSTTAARRLPEPYPSSRGVGLADRAAGDVVLDRVGRLVHVDREITILELGERRVDHRRRDPTGDVR